MQMHKIVQTFIVLLAIESCSPFLFYVNVILLAAWWPRFNKGASFYLFIFPQSSYVIGCSVGTLDHPLEELRFSIHKCLASLVDLDYRPGTRYLFFRHCRPFNQFTP